MKGELTQTITDDGLILYGLYCLPDRKKIPGVCVIHIHGSYGNFYEEDFIPEMAGKYTKSGFAFLSVNTRGHDYYAYSKLQKEKPDQSKKVGGTREIFQECESDIQAWVAYATSLGHSTIILQGHSLGAMKVIYYYTRHAGKVSGLILLSPPDNFGLQYIEIGDRFTDDLQLATALLSTDGETLMPEGAYADAITAKSFYSLFGYPVDTGMFTYSDIDLMKRAGMAAVNCPLLVTFATEDEVIADPLEICVEAMSKSVNDRQLLTIEIIGGADHYYYRKEKLLASKLVGWLKMNFKREKVKNKPPGALQAEAKGKP